MKKFGYLDYSRWIDGTDEVPSISKYILVDHLLGFNKDFNNSVLDIISKNCSSAEVVWHNIVDKKVHSNYTNLKIKFSAELQESSHLFFYDATSSLKNLKKDFTNFLCSFNGSEHISRYLLTSALDKFGWFNEYVTKNFIFSLDTLDGTIRTFCDEKTERIYRKFILSNNLDFYNKITNINYNNVTRLDHNNNIANLESYLSKSFLHLVSETMATSYQPFITEKPFYSILTKGLWLAYAAPRYHEHLEKYYGFKKFSIFSYEFDYIENPILRLVELLTSISKFSKLSIDEWNDLYEIEKETLNFNYNHYLSRDYMKNLQHYEQEFNY